MLFKRTITKREKKRGKKGRKSQICEIQRYYTLLVASFLAKRADPKAKETEQSVEGKKAHYTGRRVEMKSWNPFSQGHESPFPQTTSSVWASPAKQPTGTQILPLVHISFLSVSLCPTATRMTASIYSNNLTQNTIAPNTTLNNVYNHPCNCTPYCVFLRMVTKSG